MRLAYRTAETVSPEALTSVANTLSGEGWELIHIERLTGYGERREVWLGFFRREAAE